MGRGSLGRRLFGLCATKSRSGVQARKKVALNRVQTYLSDIRPEPARGLNLFDIRPEV